METRSKKKQRLEGCWSCLPEEVISTFYEYLSFRDVEAASQTCKSWYGAFINSRKIYNNVEFVIHRKHSQALDALSKHPSRCKRITIEDFGLDTSEREWEQVLNHWKNFSHHVNHLTFSNCKINERQIESFLCSCTSLVNLTLYYCDSTDGEMNSVGDLRNLESVKELRVWCSSTFSDTLLIKLTNFMPKLIHVSLVTDDKLGIVRRIIEPRCANIVSIKMRVEDSEDSDQLTCLLKMPDLRLKTLTLLIFRDHLTMINAIATHQTKIVHLHINAYRDTSHTELTISNENFNFLCRQLENLVTFWFNGIVPDFNALESLIYFKQLRNLQLRSFCGNNFPRWGILQRQFDKRLDMQLTHLSMDFEMDEDKDNVKKCLHFIASRLLKLEFLGLMSCSLDENLFREITTNLVNLAVLKVIDCNISDDALTGLQDVGIDVARPPLSNLKRLTEFKICYCHTVTDVSLKSAFTFCSLKKLSLEGCSQITDYGLVNLSAQPESFKRFIEELDLSRCDRVTDLGLSKLLPELKRLRVLKLTGCPKVTSKTLETVKKYCPKLRRLFWIKDRPIDLSDKRNLFDALPLLDIMYDLRNY